VKHFEGDGLERRAGDGARTRDSLLGRQVVAISPLACHKMALGVHSYTSTVIHAHLRQMVACILRQMVMDLYTGKSIHSTFSKDKRGR
jgi:hypothetical protein